MNQPLLLTMNKELERQIKDFIAEFSSKDKVAFLQQIQSWIKDDVALRTMTTEIKEKMNQHDESEQWKQLVQGLCVKFIHKNEFLNRYYIVFHIEAPDMQISFALAQGQYRLLVGASPIEGYTEAKLYADGESAKEETVDKVKSILSFAADVLAANSDLSAAKAKHFLSCLIDAQCIVQ